MEQWAEIRRRVLNGEISKRAACEQYDIHWETLQKILTYPEPSGYRRTRPRPSKLEPFLPIIHQILEDDRQVHRKQRHTAKRIFERLRDEHGYDGGETIVKDAVRAWKQQHREVFLPLAHPPGEAQVDFGFADVWWNGELTKIALFVMTLPYSDAIFLHRPITVVATTEEVRLVCADRLVARHARHWGREQSFFDPVHYLALLERKPGGFDHARPLEERGLPVCFGIVRRRPEAEFGGLGTREFIKVLRLLERHSLAALRRAVQYGLEIGAATADAFRVLLEYQQEEPAHCSVWTVGRS